MEHTLTELIHKHGNANGIPVATYSTLYGVRNKFTVPVNQFGQFFDGYCNLAYNDEKEDEGEGIPPTSLGLGEVIDSKTTLPLMGKFRFKFQVEEGEEDRSYYSEDLPMRIVKCYQKAMTDLLDISSGMSEYICCVMEGHSYRKNDEYVKIDLLIQFPFCQLDIKFTKKTFKPYVEKLLRQNKVVEAFDTHPVGDWNDHMVDVGNIIPLYRSATEQGIPHMMMSHIYGIVEDDHIQNMMGPELSLGTVFNPGTYSFICNNKIPIDSIPIEPEDGEDEDEHIRYWLPLFLSIYFWSGQTIPIQVDKNDNDYKKSAYSVDEQDSDNPARMVHALLPLLSVERANQDYSWLDIGRVLYRVFKGSDEGLNLWISFSNRANVQGRDKGICSYYYPNFKDSTNRLTVATLAWYAREDNPGGYEDWHSAWCNKALTDCLTMSHADVAKAIYRVFWLEYVYSGDTQNWYEYRENHFYKLGKEPIPLRKIITSKFVKIFEKMRLELSRSTVEDKPETGSKDLDFKIKAISELVMKLKNENYRSTIVKATKDLFHVEEFEKRCDKNHFLTAVSNCVLEVVDKKVRARPGKPEDLILKYSEIEYPFNYEWDSHWVKEVMHWFDQITVNDRELKHYFLKRIASFLRGLNPEKLFDVWTGNSQNNGNNGKSMLVKTLQKIYGAYFVDFPVSLLSTGGNKNSSSASPEIAQAVNSRAAILAEPDGQMQISSGMLKRLTGGDRIFTRALHDNGGSMELTFKTIMVCNRIPVIASVDKATINRFVIMPFLGAWSLDAPETEEEQFKARLFKLDPNFESKIPELSKALLWISVQYYPYYSNEGLLFPPIVKEYIKKHWDDNDHYLQFIAEKIEYSWKDNDKKEVDTNVSISVQELYKFFTPWFKDYFPGMTVPTLSEFRDDISMSGRLGPQSKRGVWLGLKVKNVVPDLGNMGVKI